MGAVVFLSLPYYRGGFKPIRSQELDDISETYLARRTGTVQVRETAEQSK